MYAGFKDLAARLGLVITPPDPGSITATFRFDGTVDGRTIIIARTCGTDPITTTSCPFAAPLDLGLGMSWDPSDLRKPFVVRGDDTDRVDALLDAGARDALASVHAMTVDIDDSLTPPVGVPGSSGYARANWLPSYSVTFPANVEPKTPSAPIA